MSASAMHVAKTGLNAQQTKMQIIANNLANADTPNYKARDVDFGSVLKNALPMGNSRFGLSTTQQTHLQGMLVDSGDSNLLYRTPQQPSIDGNTVEEHVEHAEYMRNALAFQTSFTFLNSKFKGLMSAIRGD